MRIAKKLGFALLRLPAPRGKKTEELCHLYLAQGGGVPLIVKQDKTLDPMAIRLFRTDAVTTDADSSAKLVQKDRFYNCANHGL
jgi:hypothetical protein